MNRFGSLRNDHDIFQTFEGDNTVLLQQVGETEDAVRGQRRLVFVPIGLQDLGPFCDRLFCWE